MSVVPIEPLLVNLLSHHVIQCQLQGEHIFPSQGSLKHVDSWSVLLEVISSLVSPDKLSQTTSQFINYVFLLESARKMEQSGQLDQMTTVKVLSLVTRFCSCPELVSIRGMFNPLLQESNIVLNSANVVSESAIRKYGKMLFDFVSAAMGCYKKLPAQDVFVAKDPPPSTPVKPKRGGKTKKGTKKPTKKIPKLEPQVTIEDVMVDVGSVETSSSDPVKKSDEEEPISLVAGVGNSEVVSSSLVKEEPISQPNLSIDPSDGNVGDLKTAEAGYKGTEIDNKSPVKTSANQRTPEVTLERCIFDTSNRTSGTEMEWSSDESSFIHLSQPKNPIESESPPKLDNSSLFNKPLIKKGAWSEEESRCLTEGVQIFGEGKWKDIISNYPTLQCRTSNQLKDRYRNIKGRSK